MIDLAALTSTIYKRAKTDAAGAPVRQLLDNQAARIIHANQLSKATLPARPLIALKRQPLRTSARQYAIEYRWYIYDDPRDTDQRLDTLAAALMTIYPTRGGQAPALILPAHDIGPATLAIGPVATDQALGLLRYSYVAIQLYPAGPR